jgi:hypothetical protein
MIVTEVDTFIQKFRDLWQSGLDAHLDLDTHAGQAWVGLRVRLGHAPGPLHHQVQPNIQRKSRNSPSRQRRRAKRASARQNEEAAKEATEVESIQNESKAGEARTIIVDNESENVEDAIAEIVASEVEMNNTDVVETTGEVPAAENAQVEKEAFDQEATEETNVSENLEENVDTAAAAGMNKVIDEICSDEVYEADDSSMREVENTDVIDEKLKMKNQYPRNCEKCDKYLRNNTDFRKHVVACVMARK